MKLSSVGLGMTATVASTVVRAEGRQGAAGVRDRSAHASGRPSTFRVQVRPELHHHQGRRGGSERRLCRPERGARSPLRRTRRSSGYRQHAHAAPTRRGRSSGSPTSSCSGDARLQRQVRVGVLRPAGQRAGRHAVGAVTGRTVLRRLQRPRLLGLRDLDVPDPAGHRARDRARRACEYRCDRLRAARAIRRRHRLVGRPLPVGERALAAARRRPRSPTPACSRSTSAPTSRSPSGSTGWPPATGTGWRPRAGRCSRASPTSGPAGRAERRRHATASAPSSRRTSTSSSVDDSVYTNVGAPRRAALRDAGGRRSSASRPRRVVAGGATGCAILFDSTARHPPRVRRLPGRRGQAGRRDAAGLPVGEPAARRGDPGRPRLLRAAHRPRRPVDDRRDPLDRSARSSASPAARRSRFTRRSVDPFMRPPYDQFSEARSGGAFTFTTGAGGFLQEFLYGYTGFRWRGDGVRLDPSLPPQLTGVTVSALHWQGRVLRVVGRPAADPGPLVSGARVSRATPAGDRRCAPGAPLRCPTRRPDLTADDGRRALQARDRRPGDRRAGRGGRRRHRHHPVDRPDQRRQRQGRPRHGRCRSAPSRSPARR